MSDRAVGYRYIKKSGGHNGARYELSVPEFFDGEGVERYSKMNGFYRGILENCREFCEREIFGGDGRGFFYLLECRVTYNDGEMACVLINATLDEKLRRSDVYMGGTRQRLGRYTHSNIWELEGDCMSDPQSLLKKLIPDRKKRPRVNKNTCLLLSGDRILAL